MPLYATIIPSRLITTDYFSLTIQQESLATQIVMRLNLPIVNTREIPQTYSILKDVLPSVLRSECFNDENLPFRQEVRQTEIGHLFEHILLDYLCIYKIADGYKKASFRGETNWNWHEDTRGTFYIDISAGFTEQEIFAKALQKTIFLVKNILKRSSMNAPLPACDEHPKAFVN